jgi:hypothetical protein
VSHRPRLLMTGHRQMEVQVLQIQNERISIEARIAISGRLVLTSCQRNVGRSLCFMIKGLQSCQSRSRPWTSIS